jgi:magnesium transporter
VPTGLAGEAVGAVLRRLETQRFEALDAVVVLDPNKRYLGTADLRDVMTGGEGVTLAAIMRTDWPRVTPQTDQEHAAEAASAAGVATVPVVAEDGSVVGCIPPATLLEVLSREHREDLHRIAGILHVRTDARHALEDPPLRRVVRRIPWLLVGLALSTSATAVMAGFEQALYANLVIAFFIPALVYLTDAIGTQTEAIVVRGLALWETPLPKLLAKEAATGGLIGLILGALAFLGVWAVFGNLLVALGVGISLFAAGTVASVIGLLLPWSLSRLGIDPAFGSGPVATIVRDVLTIFLYFLVMTSLLA